MSSLLKNILFALALAVILWLGYKVFFAEDETAPLNAEAVTEASRDTQEFLGLLQQLRVLRLDEQMFNDARFQSLVDHRQAIIPEPVGRKNPFLPIGQ